MNMKELIKTHFEAIPGRFDPPLSVEQTIDFLQGMDFEVYDVTHIDPVTRDDLLMELGWVQGAADALDMTVLELIECADIEYDVEKLYALNEDRCIHGMFFSGAGACPQCGRGAE